MQMHAADEPVDIEPPTDDDAPEVKESAEPVSSETSGEGAQRRRRRGGRRGNGSSGNGSTESDNGGEVIAAAPITSEY